MTTNEEARVVEYTNNTPPTQAQDVTNDTSLQALNLNWREQDLPERERTKHVHRLHPYLGKFIPQLVEVFLRKYFNTGDLVLDPFVGSGTTLVQSLELGIDAVGYDISAFNIILTRVKTEKYNLPQLQHEVHDILEKAKPQLPTQTPKQLPLWEIQPESDVKNKTENTYLNTWFAEQALEELLTYRSLITSEGYQYSDVLKIILSRSARSARLTTHFDLDFPKNPQTEPYYCYKHARTCHPTQEAYKFIRRYSLDTLRRIEAFDSLRGDADVDAHWSDSRSARIPTIDGIITSPPYVGLIDYHEQHRYAYELLGLTDQRAYEIGSAENGSSKAAKQQYQDDIVSVFANALNSLKSGGRVIVIANDKSELYPIMADELGVETEDVLKRHVNRRTGRRSSEYYESIFIWRKP